MMIFFDGDCSMFRVGEFFRIFGFGVIVGLVFFVDCGILEIIILGLGVIGGGVGLLFVIINFGFGVIGGFLIFRKEKIII